MLRRAGEILFGYDLFLSYARLDAERYAETLQAKLESSDITVFRDRTHLDSGQNLGEAVEKAIRRSRRFILIDTPGARQSAWVAREIESYLGRAAEGLISIRVADTSDGRAWPHIKNPERLKQIDGFNWEAETGEALVHGNPSERVVSRIGGALSSLRVRRLVRTSTVAVIVILLVLLLLSIYQTRQAISQRERAVARQLASDSELAERDSILNVELSSLLAAESARRVVLRENDERLRESLRLLPQRLADFQQDGHPAAIACSPDGRTAVIADQKGGIRAYRIPTGSVLWEAHQGDGVYGLQFSPDGREIATGSWDGTVRRLAAETGKELSQVKGSEAGKALAYSPGGDHLLAGRQDGTVTLIRIRDSAPIWSVRHEPVVNGVAISRDGRWIVSGAADNLLYIIDGTTGRIRHRVRHPSIVNAVDISPDGKYAVSACFDGNARLIEVASGRIRATWAHGASVEDARFSPDGTLVATASQDRYARVFDVQTAKIQSQFLHQGRVDEIEFHSSGRFLLTASGDRTARVFDLSWNREIARAAFRDVVRSARFVPKTNLVVAASHAGDCRIFEFDSGPEHTLGLYGEEVTRAALDKSGRRAVVAGGTLAPSLFDTRAATKPLVLSGSAVTWMAFAHEGHVAIGTYGGGIQIIGPTDRFVAGSGYSAAGAFTPDSSGLATLDDSRTVRLFDTNTPGRDPVLSIATPDRVPAGPPNLEAAAAIAITPDRQWIAAAGEAGWAKLIDTRRRKAIRTIPADGPITVLAFSPDGRFLATGDLSGNLRITSYDLAQDVFAINSGARITSICFAHSGQRLAAGDANGNVRVFSFPDGEELARIGNPSSVLALAFADGDGAVRVALANHRAIVIAEHTLDTNRLSEEVCARVKRNLTAGEWRRYLGAVEYHRTCPGY